MLPSKSVRISFAASTLAGLSRFGLSDDNRDMTLTSCMMSVPTTIPILCRLQSFQLYALEAIAPRHLHIHIGPRPGHAGCWTSGCNRQWRDVKYAQEWKCKLHHRRRLSM